MNPQAAPHLYAPTTRYDASLHHGLAGTATTGAPGPIGFDGLTGHHSTITITQDPSSRRTAVWLTLVILAVTAVITLGTTWFVMAGVDDAMSDAERMATTQQEEAERMVDEQMSSVTEELDGAVPPLP